MQTCETCRHWAKPPSSYRLKPWIGICDGSGHDEASRSAFFKIDDSHSAEIATGSDFGCVKHSPYSEAVRTDDGA